MSARIQSQAESNTDIPMEPANSFRNTVLASTLGSFVAVSLQNPVLTVKVHLQKVRMGREEIASALGIRQTVSGIYQTRGARGFWAGLPMGLMQSVPSTVAFMLTYEATKKKLRDIIGDNSVLSPAIPGMGGAIARTFTVTLVTPIELIRTIQASGVGKTSSFIANNLYQQRGIGGFYLGLKATLLRDVPYTFIYWQAYQMMRDQVLPEGIQNLGSMASVFTAGSIASTISAIFTHPFDVLKTNQQVNIRNISLNTGPITAASASATTTSSHGSKNNFCSEQCSSVVDLFRRGGVRAMFRGLSMRLAMVIPGSAIMITVYEAVKKITAMQ